MSGLATKHALTAGENEKILDVSRLVKKTKAIIQKLMKLKRKLVMITTKNIVLLQNLIS